MLRGTNPWTHRSYRNLGLRTLAPPLVRGGARCYVRLLGAFGLAGDREADRIENIRVNLACWTVAISRRCCCAGLSHRPQTGSVTREGRQRMTSGMTRATKISALMIAAALSLGTAVILSGRVVSAGMLSSAATIALLALMMMLVAPPLAFVCWWVDRDAATRGMARTRAPRDVSSAAGAVHDSETAAAASRVIPGRRPDRHTRHRSDSPEVSSRQTADQSC